ncbi:hypothetical protein RvY_02689-2 [Ramazzottius varieornatus]|uniref:Glycoside hydrolase family 31 N-terminal domain-containing protein n=1 Tax=Ramazzottius varieornatus TaxID=947166 RepID=A0A1D1URF3_RAMVA|nr:hypothetical protein RvY_02689-2 [Ramazzottius varieornatus]
MKRRQMAPLRKSESEDFKRYTSYTESKDEEFSRKIKIAWAIAIIVVIICAGIVAGLLTWALLREEATLPPAPPAILPPQEVSFGVGNSAVLSIGGAKPMKLRLRSPVSTKNHMAELTLGVSFDGGLRSYANCSNPGPAKVCYDVWTNENDNFTLAFEHKTYENAKGFECSTVTWTGTLDSEVTDCIELGQGKWYGGGLLFEQRWPMELRKNMGPFVSGDILQDRTEYGSVLEPYWISTDGVALWVDYDAKSQPLHTSFNSTGDGKLCLKSSYLHAPYVRAQQKSLQIKYTVCVGKNVQHVHKSILGNVSPLPWPRPTGIPSQGMFRWPIWSTWVSYKTSIDEPKLIEFIDRIHNLGFGASNIEIDDGYQLKYGDFSFNLTKFPDPSIPIEHAHRYGYNVTVWVYPFINHDSSAMNEGLLMLNRSFVLREDGRIPAMTWWWQGHLAALVDFTNPEAARWYLSRLEQFRDRYNITSFKQDGGEAGWTPNYRKFHEDAVNPDYYGKAYINAVCAEENKAMVSSLEFRIGLHTQHQPIFVRMLDKDSVEGYDNGLRTMIPSALTFGILGYPFVLPDMIGGNAYRNVSEGDFASGLLESQFPSEKLFLRWLAATVFMPSIQFSIPPWIYSGTATSDALKLMNLRAKHVDLFVQLAIDSTRTGYPIVRPMWWIDGDWEAGWNIDDQFLVGDDLMVAPLLDPESSSRSVQIPPGRWRNELDQKDYTGPALVHNFHVRDDQVLHFFRQK